MSVKGRESMTPPWRWNVLFQPKRGDTEDEYEDAWAADPARGRFAVDDGASETAFAGRWAQLLTEEFLEAKRPLDLTAWLEQPRQRWADEMMSLELPWYAEMKRELGGFAAFLGVRLHGPSADRPASWRAVAVGDSCLIRVRQDGRIRSFPMRKASDFGNQPRLIGSRGHPEIETAYAHGVLSPGDRLLLLTDALAQWHLQCQEQGGRAGDDVAAVLSADQPDAAFASWIEEQRDRGELRNDDVTLLAIDLSAIVEASDSEQPSEQPPTG